MLNTQTMQLQLRPDGKYIELGGGAMPVIRPNCDCRWCFTPEGVQTTDFVADFNAPLPIGSDELDGVFSKFAIEHISWRNVPAFVKECRRILKTGGDICLVMPNTQAQMEHLLRTQDWDDASSMLFGDNDYPENTHRAFFNPVLISRLLQQAGFSDIMIVPFGEKATDMIVQAKAAPPVAPQAPLQQAPTAPQGKPSFAPLGAPQAPVPTLGSTPNVKDGMPPVTPFRDVKQEQEEWDRISAIQEGAAGGGNRVPSEPVAIVAGGDMAGAIVSRGEAGMVLSASPYDSRLDDLRHERKLMFDRRYFDGGGPWGGYQFYWDFPCHEVTAQKILALRPESALELGCSRGYVVKRLQDAGVIACGWDISRHCWLTRITDGVTETDATDPASWARLKDGNFDLCYSIAFLDHVPEELLPDVLAGMARKCKRGIHGVNCEPQGGDRTRATCRPLSWWRERMPLGHQIVDKADLEEGRVTSLYYEGDGKVKLNVGSFTTMFHNGWVNIDVHPNLDGFAQNWGFKYQLWDVREGLPYGTESVDMIFASHMFEHLTYAEGQEFLRECRRVLKPDGVLRLSVPDAGKLARYYAYTTAPESDGSADRSLFDLGQYDEMSGGAASHRQPAAKLYELLCAEHKALYDAATLKTVLHDAFLVPSEAGFRRTASGRRQILSETIDLFPEMSLYMDAVPYTGG